MVLGGILVNRSRAVSGNDEHKYALFPSHVNFTRILSSLKDKTHRAPLIYWCFTKHQSAKWFISELFSFCICVVERVTQISIPITYSKTDTILGSFDIKMKTSSSTPKRNLDLIWLLPRPVSY